MALYNAMEVKPFDSASWIAAASCESETKHSFFGLDFSRLKSKIVAWIAEQADLREGLLCREGKVETHSVYDFCDVKKLNRNLLVYLLRDDLPGGVLIEFEKYPVIFCGNTKDPPIGLI